MAFCAPVLLLYQHSKTKSTYCITLYLCAVYSMVCLFLFFELLCYRKPCPSLCLSLSDVNILILSDKTKREVASSSASSSSSSNTTTVTYCRSSRSSSNSRRSSTNVPHVGLQVSVEISTRTRRTTSSSSVAWWTAHPQASPTAGRRAPAASTSKAILRTPAVSVWKMVDIPNMIDHYL